MSKIESLGMEDLYPWIGVIIGGVVGFILYSRLSALTNPFIGVINGAVFGFVLCLFLEVFILEHGVKQSISSAIAASIISAICFGFWLWFYVREAPVFTNPEVLTTPAAYSPEFQVPAVVGLAIISLISGLLCAGGGMIISELIELITGPDFSIDLVFIGFILGSISLPGLFFFGEILLSPLFIIPVCAFIGYPIGILMLEKAEQRIEKKKKSKMSKAKIYSWIFAVTFGFAGFFIGRILSNWIITNFGTFSVASVSFSLAIVLLILGIIIMSLLAIILEGNILDENELRFYLIGGILIVIVLVTCKASYSLGFNPPFGLVLSVGFLTAFALGCVGHILGKTISERVGIPADRKRKEKYERKLKKLERKLNSLNTEGLESEVNAIKSKLKDPEKVKEIEREVVRLKQKIKEKERKRIEEEKKYRKVKEKGYERPIEKELEIKRGYEGLKPVIKRETEFFNGFIRLKMAVTNPMSQIITDVSLDLDFDENTLRLDRHEPEYPVKKEKVQLGTINPGTGKTVAFYLDPMTCTKAGTDINCRVDYKDAYGNPDSIRMETKKVEVVCPIFSTESDINIGMLKEFIENLPYHDSKIYKIPPGLETNKLIEICRETIQMHDVRHIRTLRTKDGKTCETWYYGKTKVAESNIVIKASINEETESIEIFAATPAPESLTGLLAELGHNLTKKIKEIGKKPAQVVNVSIKDTIIQRSPNLLNFCDLNGVCREENIIIEDSVIQRSRIGGV